MVVVPGQMVGRGKVEGQNGGILLPLYEPGMTFQGSIPCQNANYFCHELRIIPHTKFILLLSQ
jgi:hypothetical protein